MDRIETAFGPWVIKQRWWIILFSLLLVGFSAAGGKNLYFTNNYRIFFSEDNPQLLAFEELENTYSKNDNVLIVLEPKDGNVFTRKTLSVIEELTNKLWQVPFSSRVDSITNFQYTVAEGDDLTVGDLVEEASTLSDEALEKIRAISLSEPLLVNRLISEKAHVTGINVTVQLPRLNEATETPEVVEFIRKLVDDVRATNPDINVYLSGVVLLNNAFSESAKSDMKVLIPISFALMFLILAILVGGISGTFCTILVIAFSIITAMGLGGHIGMSISPPSSSAPTIILTVAIANCVHILVTALHNLRHGMQRNEAIQESLRVNLQPVFLASLTTALGFLTMNFSEVPPFRDLGNFVAMGVLTSFILSITFLPALMSLLPISSKRISNNDDTAMTKLGDFVVERRTPLLWGMTVIVLILLSGLPRNELNDIFVHYFDKRTVFRTDTDFLTENLTGINSIEYSLKSGEPGGISDPKFLHDVEAFANWYRQQPETIHVNTLTDIMKRLNKNMHGDDQAMYRLPTERDLSAQYLLLYEMSLPYGLDLNNQINIDKSSIRFIVTLKTFSTNEILALERRAKQWLADNAPDIKSADSSGVSFMFANIGKRNIVSMLFGTTVALLLISFVLILAFRSIKIGLISLIPNLVPAAMGFGLWGFFVGEVGIALSVVSTMSLGIIVDDTVHFLSKYMRARRENNMNSQEAVRYAFKTVGRALIITSVILTVGFLVLTTSSFKLNSGMGLLTAIVISIALITDFFLLPTILMKIEEKNDAEMLAADTVINSSTT